MKIIVCVKIIPLNTSFDEKNYRLNRFKVEMEMNSPDRYAIDMALQLKKIYGGNITVLTMGIKQVEESLRFIYALGVDNIILLNDISFAGSDTYATSYILAKAIKKVGEYDVILCGRHSLDGDTGQTGPGIAGFLNIPHLCYVREVELYRSRRIICKRQLDVYFERVSVSTPCLLCVDDFGKTFSYPNLESILNSNNKDIKIWDIDDIKADNKKCGIRGSLTSIKRVYGIENVCKARMLTGDLDDITKDIITILNGGSK